MTKKDFLKETTSLLLGPGEQLTDAQVGLLEEKLDRYTRSVITKALPEKDSDARSFGSGSGDLIDSEWSRRVKEFKENLLKLLE